MLRIALLAVLVALGSCTVPWGASGGTRLVLHLGTPGRFAVSDLASWTLSGEGPEASSFEVTATGTSVQVSNLIPGSWKLHVEGRDAAGALVLAGSREANLVAGSANVVSIPLGAVATVGVTIDLSDPASPELSWDAGTGREVVWNGPNFAATVNGDWDSVTWFVNGDQQPETGPTFHEGLRVTNPDNSHSYNDLLRSGLNHLLVVVTRGTQTWSVDFVVFDTYSGGRG